MSTVLVRAPIYAVGCDTPDCGERFHAHPSGQGFEYVVRRAAAEAGWAMRPNYGKGSRSWPDLCPQHAPRVRPKP